MSSLGSLYAEVHSDSLAILCHTRLALAEVPSYKSLNPLHLANVSNIALKDSNCLHCWLVNDTI